MFTGYSAIQELFFSFFFFLECHDLHDQHKQLLDIEQ